MRELVVKTNKRLLEMFYRNKYERAVEEELNKLYRVMMKESSKHYITKIKLERVEIARLDAVVALEKEKRAHERTKENIYVEIENLKYELEKYKNMITTRETSKVL